MRASSMAMTGALATTLKKKRTQNENIKRTNL
jgi:hypothetical protein